MLSQEGSDNREWNGLKVLRSLLQKEAKLIELSPYRFIACDEDRFEYASKLLRLAAIVGALRTQLIQAIAVEPPESRQTLAREVGAELERLAGEVKALRYIAADASELIERIGGDVYRVAW